MARLSGRHKRGRDIRKVAFVALGAVAGPVKAKHACLARLTECGKPAGYALINTELSYVCKEHKDKE